MGQSFGVVEDKVREAEFFLDKLSATRRFSSDARFYFSAFVSAARSITNALQASLSDVAGFKKWYQSVQNQLKGDPLTPFFVEIRNGSIHRGLNPLNQTTLSHLREDLFNQMAQRSRPHILVLPSMCGDGSTVLADAVQASTLYFTSLVTVVFECYDKFRCVVDPQWYFTPENFATMGKTFDDAIVELGFPPVWATCAPEGTGWRVLRRQQQPCQINDIFRKYLGREIAGPDDSGEEEGRGTSQAP